MRILAFIVGILLILFGGVYFLLFSQTGNDIVKPYIESFVSKKLQKEVKITNFTLKTDHLSLGAKVPNEASLIVDGDISLFKQSFDLLYQCQAQNLQTPVMLIKEKLEVSGKATGVVDDFVASGDGKAFGSNINFNIHVVEKTPKDGQIDAKGIDVGQVLDFLGKPRYTNGKVDVVANVKNSGGSIEGVANALIHESVLDEKLIQRDFNLTLPKNVTYVGKVDGDIKGDDLHVKSNIVSSLASLKTTDTKVDLKTQNITSDFLLDIANLTKLEPIIHKKLYGNVKINGDVKKEGEKVAINAKSDIFGGKLGANFQDDKLKASLKNANIKHILAMLGESAYGYGILDVDVDLKDVSKKKRAGDMKLKVENGELVGSSALRKQTGLNLPPVTQFNADINALLQGDLLEASTNIASTLARIKTKKTTANLATQSFGSDFDVNIENLAHIGKIINQELQGKIDVVGNAKFENALLSLNANTKSLGGDIDIKLDQQNLNLTIKEALISKLAHLLKKDGVVKGVLDAQANIANINSDNLNGTINYELKNGELLGKGMEALTKLKFPSSTALSLNGNADIKNGIATFKSAINSSLASIPNFNGVYNIPKKRLESKYALHVKDLTKLEFITSKKLHGELKADGDVNMKDKNLYATFNAPFLGGQTKTLFDKGILKTKATKISIKGVSELLDTPYVFSSDGDFNLTYNTKTKKGDYNLLMKEGKMVKNQLSDLVLAFSGYDLLKEVYKDTLLKGVIDKDNATYTLDMKGQKTFVNIPNGIANFATKQTRADFNLKFQKTDLKGVIKGDISAPKVSIKGSQYLQQKAVDAVEKYLPKEQKGIVKDVLKLFN